MTINDDRPGGAEPRMPQPFAPLPQAGDDGGARFGCSKPALVGCGLVLLVLMVASVLLVFNSGRLFRWGLSQSRNLVIAALPDDLEAEERRRLDAAFEAVADAVTESRVDADGIRRLQEALQQTLAKTRDGTLSRQDVLELAGELEAVAGVPAPSEGRSRIWQGGASRGTTVGVAFGGWLR